MEILMTMQLFYKDPDVQALAKVVSQLRERDREFAENLMRQSETFRGLTEKQRHWVLVLTERANTPEQKPATIADFSGVVALLDGAAQKLKHPKLLVRVVDRDLRLTIAGQRSAAPGSINISSTEKAFADRTWFGRVSRDGVFEPSRSLTQATATAIAAALTALAADPAKVASVYGHQTGNCCFCGLELTDSRSIHVGYGPVCAEKWGLPWGEKPEPKAKAPAPKATTKATGDRSAAARRAWETRRATAR
jgi:hypothetical protein